MPNYRAGLRDVFAEVVDGAPAMKVKRGAGMQVVTYWEVVMLNSAKGKETLRGWADECGGEQRFRGDFRLILWLSAGAETRIELVREGLDD